MKIVICDDQVCDIEELSRISHDYFNKNGIDVEIIGTTDSDKILKYNPDILILDIEMPNENGIDVKDRLALQGDRPLIIFATNYPDAISRAFNKNVIGFITKPIIPEQLYNCLNVAVTHISLGKTIQFDDGTMARSEDIIMITACSGYSDFLLASGANKNGGKHTMKFWEDNLKPCGFIRIDDGKIVNCKYIKSFLDKEIIIPSGKESSDIRLKISRRRKNICKVEFLDFCRKNGKYI